MAIVALIALVLASMAVAQSKRRLQTFLFILGWTVAASATGGLLAFILATVIHAGNPPAVAGDIAGPLLTLALLISSANRVRENKRAQRLAQLSVGN